MAAEALLAIGRFAMPDQIATPTVTAVNSLRNHGVKRTLTTSYVPLPK